MLNPNLKLDFPPNHLNLASLTSLTSAFNVVFKAVSLAIVGDLLSTNLIWINSKRDNITLHLMHIGMLSFEKRVTSGSKTWIVGSLIK